MIIVKEIENEKHFLRCTGCGEVENPSIHIEIKNIVEGTGEHLSLCSTCKTTLIRELLSTQYPGDFENVKDVLKDQISVLETDRGFIEERWKHKFGSPLTNERILEYQDNAMSIAYLQFTQMIKDCEVILKVI